MSTDKLLETLRLPPQTDPPRSPCETFPTMYDLPIQWSRNASGPHAWPLSSKRSGSNRNSNLDTPSGAA